MNRTSTEPPTQLEDVLDFGATTTAAGPHFGARSLPQRDRFAVLKKLKRISELFPKCPIFPLLIAGLHYANVQISFKTSSLKTMKGKFGTLAKYYKHYLDIITLPLFFLGYNIPQGILVYWVTNNSVSVIQLCKTGVPTELEDVDNLILASQWTGVGYIRQGIFPEGIVHLEKIAQLKEPEEPKIKAHYFDGLLMLASALSNVGRKEEALKHLRLAAAYNPAYNEYVEQCEYEDDGLVNDLASSRRSDY